MPPSAAPQLNFLGSSLSLADAAADWLLAQANFDFAQSLIIVPTARAGERLRASLEARGAACMQILTGGECMSRLLSDKPFASPVVSRRLMATAIRQLREEGQCAALFPIQDTSAITDAGILKTADLLLSVRHTLVEEGLSLRAALAGLLKMDGFTESDRWEDMLYIENLYVELIENAGLCDRDSELLTVLDSKEVIKLPAAIVFAFNPDPPPFLLKLLDGHPIACSVLVAAHQEMRSCFDAWGRPLPSFWANSTLATISLGAFQDTVVVSANTADLARHLSQSLEGGEAVGILHDDLASEFDSLCAIDGIPTYNPSGVLAFHTGVGALLEILPRFIRSRSFPDVLTLIRHADVRQWVLFQWGKSYPAQSLQWRRLLCELDNFSNERLPGTLESALILIESVDKPEFVRFVLHKLNDFCQALSSTNPRDVRAFFTEFFAVSRLIPANDPAHIEATARAQFFEILDSLEGQWDVFSSSLDLIQSLATQFRSERVYYARPNGAREYQGWLELSYDSAPKLLLYGLIEGVVPSSLHSEAFLPEGARRALGLRTSDRRYAHDAFLLWHMLESRRDLGSVRIGFPQRGGDGAPLKPSRLLFHCPNSELPQRVAYLFTRKSESFQRPPWELAWKLQPPRPDAVSKIEKLRVTAFREYLECPYRFYLRNMLKMAPFEPNRLEMDERSFGNLMHNTLEAFGRSSVNSSRDAATIAEFCDKQLIHQVEQIYGNRAYRNLAVELQVESALQRLRAFAQIQAKEAGDGWQILAVEQKFEIPFTIEERPIKISGTIDRIERRINPKTNVTEWRVLDYKTYDKSDSSHAPRKDHITKIGKTEPPSFAVIDEDSCWKNLQLPLYIYALKYNLANVLPISPGKEDLVSTAYIILPKAVSATELLPWSLSAEELSAASDCAEGILESVLNGVFWPPACPRYDDFEEILSFPDAEQSVESPA